MKKIITLIVSILVIQMAYGQGRHGLYNSDIIKVVASLVTLVIFMVFILAILKRYLDHRLKNKIVDKGVSETIASSILQSNPQEDRNANIKWFSLLAGTGAGLTIVYFTQPLGIHSLAIMCFSVSASFLGYYFFIKETSK